MTVVLILLDVALIVTDLWLDCPADPASRAISSVDLAISCYFVLEICLRAAALKPRVFFSRRHWFNVVDLLIVVVTFAVSVVYVYAASAVSSVSPGECWPKESDLPAASELLPGIRVLVARRFVRFVRLFRLARLYTEHHMVKRAVRQKVSQNKRRFQRDGVDLDLTYVTRRVIAMSFPSSGIMAWYRNSIRDVSRFLDKAHGGKYRVYNLCSERTYDDRWFHGQVRHYPVDDHNVPSVAEMADFVREVRQWLAEDPEHVIAVHCKGGKGRTGTMICILLIELGLFRDAADSLEYFGQRRTDRNVSKRFQGVETASQIRYVSYYERLRLLELEHPPQVPVNLKEISITGISSVGKGDGSDLSLEVSVGRGKEPVYTYRLGRSRAVTAEREEGIDGSRFDGDSDCITIYIPTCPKVHETNIIHILNSFLEQQQQQV